VRRGTETVGEYSKYEPRGTGGAPIKIRKDGPKKGTSGSCPCYSPAGTVYFAELPRADARPTARHGGLPVGARVRRVDTGPTKSELGPGVKSADSSAPSTASSEDRLALVRRKIGSSVKKGDVLCISKKKAIECDERGDRLGVRRGEKFVNIYVEKTASRSSTGGAGLVRPSEARVARKLQPERYVFLNLFDFCNFFLFKSKRP